MSYKKNVAIKINYVALHRTAGLLDLKMKVYDEAGIEVPIISPITLTEITGGGGAYYGSFTPDAKGQWRIRIQSATNNDDVQKVFEISDSDIDEIKLQTQSIENKADIIDANVDLVKIETDKIQAVKTKTDNLPVNTATELDAIDDALVNIDAQISTGGYILN